MCLPTLGDRHVSNIGRLKNKKFSEVKKPENINVYLNTNHGRIEIPKKRSFSRKNGSFRSSFEFDFDVEDLHISLVENSEKLNFDHFIASNQ